MAIFPPRVRATLALLFLVGAASAQTQETDPEVPRQWLTKADAPGIIVTLAILLAIPTAVYVWQRRRVSFADTSAEEARFEREALLQARLEPSPPPEPARAPKPAREAEGGFLASPHIARAPGFDKPGWSQIQTAVETPEAEASGHIVVESPIGSPRSAPAAAAPPAPHAPGAGGIDTPPANVEELVRRLQTLGILGEIEGRVAMAIPPDGLIVRIRRTRGLALAMPRFESEAVMAHHVRRFDMVFSLTAAGEVLVLSRLQARLAEMLEFKG